MNPSATSTKKYPLWLFILLPGITMMLGWGLRGFIGGGPYGAMIPGAMVMTTICMLLEIPFSIAAVMVVFGTAGIGMGGEMTYGQTLGFLRKPETVWWGTCGTTVKGGVWGLVGGTIIGMGLIYRNLKPKIIIAGLLFFLIALVVGLKLINDPKLVYFSDPVNKPRKESWAGLLFGAVALLTWLKSKISTAQFKLVLRFAKYGLIGGALGFGLGAYWIVIGSLVIKHSWISDWWKLMEFSFGFSLGSFFGYATWLSRHEIKFERSENAGEFSSSSFLAQFMIVAVTGLLIYVLIPIIDPFVEAESAADGIFMLSARTFARIIINFTFVGSLLIVIAMRWPFAALQLAVTLTFCHTVIDLVEDLVSKNIAMLSGFAGLCITVLSSLIISFLVALSQRKPAALKSIFMTLVWSTVGVAIIRMLAYKQFQMPIEGSVLQFVFGHLMVFDFFIVSALTVTLLIRKFRFPGSL